jgi:hypothetical protein
MSGAVAERVHLWLVGDRIACLSCGRLAGDVRFVGPGRPLCGACGAAEPLPDEEDRP